jgi:hypothetical protein
MADIKFSDIYKICKKYGTKKAVNAWGGTYKVNSPKQCAEKIWEYLKEKE